MRELATGECHYSVGKSSRCKALLMSFWGWLGLLTCHHVLEETRPEDGLALCVLPMLKILEKVWERERLSCRKALTNE